MASLFEYFKVDFANSLGQTSELETSDPNVKIKINSNVGVETYSNAKFVAYYIPECANPLPICFSLIVHTPNVISESNNVVTYSSFPGENNLGLTGSDNSVFANRIYLYSETEISDDDIKKLEECANTNRLYITVRSK